MMESKFTKEEIKDIKDKLSQIGSHIPSNLATWVWGTYLTISGHKENQPCTCGSAGKHWRRAVETISAYVRDYDNR